MSYYHEDKKCKNCVLNGDCLIENPEDCDIEDCNIKEDIEKEEDEDED